MSDEYEQRVLWLAQQVGCEPVVSASAIPRNAEWAADILCYYCSSRPVVFHICGEVVRIMGSMLYIQPVDADTTVQCHLLTAGLSLPSAISALDSSSLVRVRVHPDILSFQSAAEEKCSLSSLGLEIGDEVVVLAEFHKQDFTYKAPRARVSTMRGRRVSLHATALLKLIATT